MQGYVIYIDNKRVKKNYFRAVGEYLVQLRYATVFTKLNDAIKAERNLLNNDSDGTIRIFQVDVPRKGHRQVISLIESVDAWT